LKPTELDTAIHLATEATLGQSIDSAGFDSNAIREKPSPLTAANVRGFIELHIEQGPVLVNENAPVGIVTGIRGTIRLRNASCIGAYSHSGAVLQELRRDAVLATAEFINQIEQHCTDLRTQGNDIVFAVGKLHTDASIDSLSKVPGLVNFTIDLRSQQSSILKAVNSLLDNLANEISKRRNVKFEIGNRAIAEPTTMAPTFRAILREAAKTLCIKAPELSCGAGHDAAEFVRAGIPSCMIFVRNTGESHNPEENMEWADFRSGVALLAYFLAAVANT
jgi:N-carbamoyl-L-amino-acid hydrolase